jgi:hypothetical protein
VKRQKGRYFLTSFGMVMYGAQGLLGNAVKDYCKLKAIDSFGVANKEDSMSKEDNRTDDKQSTNQRDLTFNKVLAKVLLGQYGQKEKYQEDIVVALLPQRLQNNLKSTSEEEIGFPNSTIA